MAHVNCDLYWLIDKGALLEQVLIEGRILSSACHDTSNPEIHTHWHRRILHTYDPKRKTVLLSLKGSANSLNNLDIPERDFTPDELYSQDWTVRASDYEIF